MIISVSSGKGGTGKTTLAVNLALSIDNAQILDCDVEEPNAHIFIKPTFTASEQAGIPVPQIDELLCDYCGICAGVCAYNAIAVLRPAEYTKGSTLVFEHLCHGCGACAALCPRNAIKEVNREVGIVEWGKRGNLEFVHGKLNVGEAMAPPIIRQVKKHINKNKTVIIDAPPGTSCPVVASVKGSDFAVLVTEPTPFGLNDLILAVEVLKKLKIPMGVVINRADLGNNKTDEYCFNEKIPVLMKIPFKREIAEAYSRGTTIVEAFPEYKKSFKVFFNKIAGLAKLNG